MFFASSATRLWGDHGAGVWDVCFAALTSNFLQTINKVDDCSFCPKQYKLD